MSQSINHNNNNIIFNKEKDEEAVERFREYLRIKSVHPKPDLTPCLTFFEKYSKLLNVQSKVLQYAENLPIFTITIPGSDPTLPAVLLNSHMDVVPIVEEKWTKPAWEGYLEADTGNIYGRGAQDMKCVTIQHLEALLRLLEQNTPLLRTIHLSIVPDEEMGGTQGMKLWCKSKEFEELNVGVVLDEGLANPDDLYTVFYGERAAWWVDVKAEGNTGHGSRFIQNTATSKLLRVIDRFLQFRKEQEDFLSSKEACACGKTLGDVTTVNLTILQAGTAYNVVPPVAHAGFDIRIPPSVDLEAFKLTLKEWTDEEGVSFEFVNYHDNNHPSKREGSEWWEIMNDVLGRDKVKAEIFPAATDSRYIRHMGIPAYGFSPMKNTPILLHDHDEFLNKGVFVEGIYTFVSLIQSFANHPNNS